MTQRILNIDEIDLRSSPVPLPDALKSRFEGSAMGDVGRRLGAQKLGYNVTVVPPGKRAFPFHNHRVNEEMFFVLEGEGEVRVGPDRYPIRRGDFIACPPGGPETAHQIVNTSAREIRYLAVSTRISPEIVDYPDSKKFGVATELPPGADGKPQVFRFLGRVEDSLAYWDGEPSE